jgi:hypothetical protein
MDDVEIPGDEPGGDARLETEVIERTTGLSPSNSYDSNAVLDSNSCDACAGHDGGLVASTAKCTG